MNDASSNTPDSTQQPQRATAKKTNKYLAPVVIAGVTIGFLASAYKFVFAKPQTAQNNLPQPQQQESLKQQDTDETASH